MAYDPNDPEDKKVFDAAVEEETKGLKAKQSELLAEIKTLKKQIRDGIADPKALEKAEARVEELEGLLETAQSDFKEADKRATKAEKGLETESAFTRNLLVDNGLTEALTKANVANQFLPAVKAMLAGKVQIVADKKDGSRKAMVGDKELGAFVTEWSQGDEGKHYVTAPVNRGGDAPGGRAPAANGKTMTRSAWDAADHTARAAFSKEGGTVIDG